MKDAFSHEEAHNIIVNERGKAFDPDIVDAFLTHEDKFLRIYTELHS